MRTRRLARLAPQAVVLSIVLAALGAAPPGNDPAPAASRKLPEPRSILGYDVGERFSDFDRMSHFLETVCAGSDRVRIIPYGETAERRELRLFVISSPENLAREAEIRRTIALLSDPRRLDPGVRNDESKIRALIEKLPVLVWLSFNVHGDESSSTEAAMQLVHDLLGATDEATLRCLGDAVIIVDPCLNPDGRERYVSWFNSVSGPSGNPDPQSAEHDQPWPGGRYNHYLFDLNRDWAFLTQAETRARVKAYLEWNPQVHVDFHEMFPESSYFFFPADAPINRNLPASTVRWAKVFGEGNARAFDRHGWPYYTEEFFDLYYPGYGDSWPSFQGAIGMTYEQAGHGAAGLAVKRADDTILTLRDRVQHHATAAMSTIETAAAHRAELLLDYYRFRRDAVEEGNRGEVREFLLGPGKDPGRTAELVTILMRQGVEVRRATKPFVAERLLTYDRKRVDLESFPAGTYLVSPAQPLHGLVMTLLEPETRPDRFYFYDISAWSLPLAFGVDGYVALGPVAVEAETLLQPPEAQGGLDGERSSVAYLLPWDRDAAPKLLYRALAEGFRARVATKEFTLDGKDYGRGTVIFFVANNPEPLHDRIAALAAEEEVVVDAARSSLTEKGIDLGSELVAPLEKPRIAVLTGEGIEPTAFGTIWFLLAVRCGMDISALPLRSLGAADLSRYSVLIGPDGSGYGESITDPVVSKMKQWIEAGGTYIGIEGGAAMACQEGKKIVPVSTAEDEPKKKEEKPRNRPRKIEEALDVDRRDTIPGTMLKVDLDLAHPVTFGYPSEIVILKRGDFSFKADGPALAIGTFLPEPVSGYIAPEKTAKLGKRAFLVAMPMGRGQAVLYADDPNFRMFFRGLTRLFLNSILLLPRPAR